MKRKIFKIVTVLVILFSSSISNASEWEQVVNLRGYWKFTIGDDMKWSDPIYNDRNWEEIRVPSSWESEGFHGYNGYAWYRTTFDYPKDAGNYSLHLYLGFIDDVDEVYINGKLVGLSGNFPPNYSTAYNAERSYPIPPQILKSRENVIAVRVFDSQLSGGILRGDVGVYAYTDGMKLDINLEGEWKFKTGDRPEWREKSFNDSDWKRIFVPGTWESRGWSDYDGMAWYRLKFFLPENFNTDKMILVLGRIDDIDETYLNGVKVGSTGEFKDKIESMYFNNEWQQFRGYYLMDGVLKPGEENVLAVRVYDGYLNGGIYDGPIGLITQDKYREYWKNKKKKKNIWDLIFGN